MTRKQLLTIFGIGVLGLSLWKTISGTISPLPKEEFAKELFPLGIGLLFILIFIKFVNQKNWRIGCLMIGASKILIYGGTISDHKLGIFLYILNMPIIATGLLNFYYFYKSDFEIRPNSKQSNVLTSTLPIIFLLFIFIIIFIFSRVR